ncbi:MAG: alpha/beta hydrolase [Deltaproteobacteria bacterium]|nr:alpha/beta hydrolase [Deltaproteobacteria bacterium]
MFNRKWKLHFEKLGIVSYIVTVVFLALVLLSPRVNAQMMSLKGELLVAGGRIEGLILTTGDRETIETTLAKIKHIEGDGPGVWSYEWRLVGDNYEALGDKLAKVNKIQEALTNYEKAISVYSRGYLPGNYSPSERKSFIRFRDLALKMNQYLAYPFEVVKVPFEGKQIIVHLYKPKGVEKPGLVLCTGGIDGSKEGCKDTAQSLVPKGIAVAAFDLAGTGESTDWLLRPDSHKLHKRILDYFEAGGEYDFNRIGMFAGSFGGYYAIRMAADEKRLKAVVDHCGIVHSAFQVTPEAMRSVLHSAPGAMVYSTIRSMGFDPAIFDKPDESNAGQREAMLRLSSEFSLISQGVVGTGKETIQTPLLIVHSTNDAVVSEEDIELVEKAAANSETWVLGQGHHCAPCYMPVAKPHMVNWLVEKLNVSEKKRQKNK